MWPFFINLILILSVYTLLSLACINQLLQLLIIYSNCNIHAYVLKKNIIAVKFRILRLNRNIRPGIDKVYICSQYIYFTNLLKRCLYLDILLFAGRKMPNFIMH